jgi:ribosomal protein S18 acetylase RimI-like enzyme
MKSVITHYANDPHRQGVIALWNRVFGQQTAHRDPALAIDKKVAMPDGLFFVAVADGSVTGTVMAGYDGHRGWLYSVAVDPACRGHGLGTALIEHAEAALIAKGCMKINLQVVSANRQVTAFYESLGYSVEPHISMGKRLDVNIG